MEIPIHITFRHMEPSAALSARIEAEAAKLETFFDRITSCRVTVEAPHRHHKWGDHFHVRIELGVPGTELVVSREPAAHGVSARTDSEASSKAGDLQPDHKDAHIAIHDAFVSARRQVQEYAKQLRVKSHLAPVAK